VIASSSGLGSGRRSLAATTTFPNPATVALPGPRSRRSGAGGPKRPGGTPCRSRAQAARVRSTSFSSHPIVKPPSPWERD